MLIVIGDGQKIIEFVDPAFGKATERPSPFPGLFAFWAFATRHFHIFVGNVKRGTFYTLSLEVIDFHEFDIIASNEARVMNTALRRGHTRRKTSISNRVFRSNSPRYKRLHLIVQFALGEILALVTDVFYVHAVAID